MGVGHGIVQANISAFTGGDVGSAFLSSVISSGVGSGTNGLSKAGQLGISTLTGAGLSTAMNGGNFWENLAYSSAVVGLNHLMQHITRPRMIDMQKNYPVNPDGSEMSAKDVFKKVGGEVYEATGGEGNACATRVSYALNRSGVKIPKMSFTLKGKDGNNYIVNAAKLNGWLIKVFGNPDMSLTDPTFPMMSLMGNGLNQGLYVMLPQSYDSFGASGHATLFLGGGCISNHCYFENAKTINLWRLK